ncbi:hypothetical protein BUL40_10350 [Croceivirga radicis]|uniref:Uncharacterized protein n=1 Tax=Croceivirga radicis TaxID=1929488 RepID=A0A1V6LQQ2_9FLAO|nr:hypothetical protein [Croceivirga radicis]OQD42513.1 hypothetical protein BUL40_10350 [Croceivirga radicis]
MIENLVRVEVAVKKMAYVKKFNIIKPSDLLMVNKVKLLGNLIVHLWEEIIYFDKQLMWRDLSVFQQKKVLYYATPRNWEDFNRVQRTRAKQHFLKLYLSPTYKEIGLLLVDKWNFLTAEKRIRFNHKKINHSGKEMYTFYSLECKVKTYKQDQGEKIAKNITQKQCKVCGKNIRLKRSDAIYCSKKCNNKYHSELRKKG